MFSIFVRTFISIYLFNNNCPTYHLRGCMVSALMLFNLTILVQFIEFSESRICSGNVKISSTLLLHRFYAIKRLLKTCTILSNVVESGLNCLF